MSSPPDGPVSHRPSRVLGAWVQLLGMGNQGELRMRWAAAFAE